MLTESSPSLRESSDCDMSQFPPAILDMIAEFFKVLSETSRLQILCSLKSGTKNVSEIIEITGLGQANVSKHLKMLSQSGIVERSQQGVQVYYTISNPLIFTICDLVCNSLASNLQQQEAQFKSLQSLQNYF
jgi:DNA-binding transcriptional ArsR family regulator